MTEDVKYVSEQIVIRLGYGNFLKQYHTNRISIPCMFHDDSTPSMSLYLDTGTYKCFGCGAHGTLRTLYREHYGHSINKDLGIKYEPEENSIVNLFRSKVSSEDLSKTPNTNIALSGEFIPASRSVDAKRFLKKRGISLKIAESMKMSIGKNAYSYNKSDKNNREYFINFSDRLCIPVYESGKLLSCEGRDIYGERYWKDQAKKKGIEDFIYKKCIYPKLSSTNTLYQLQKLKFNNRIYFVEGLLDLAVLRTSEFFTEKNSTSIFGASLTNRQYYLLFKFPKLCYIIDNDLAGWTSLRSFYNHIINSDNILNKNDYKFIVPPFEELGVKDIGDIPQKTEETIDSCLSKNWLSAEKTIIDYKDLINDKVDYFIRLKEKKLK